MSKRTSLPPSERSTEKAETAKLPNAVMPAFASYNADGVYQPGLSKAEWATGQFIAAHIQAHGTWPTREMFEAYAEVATMLFNSWIVKPDLDGVEDSAWAGSSSDEQNEH